MSKHASFQHSRRPSLSRVRGAVVAAGLGTSMVLGVGAAFAAGAAGAPGSASLISAGAAESVAQQAAAQSKAAKAAAHAKAVKAAAHAKAVKAAKKAAAKKAASWGTPVHHYALSASYGNDGARWSHKHSGQDFAVPVGTKVQAAHGGTVVKAGPNGGGDGPAYGNAVVISHGNGTYSQYAHLSRIDVHIGQTVKSGEKIALSGNTGNSSGPHLHFEIRNTPHYGSAVNPVSFLHKKGVQV